MVFFTTAIAACSSSGGSATPEGGGAKLPENGSDPNAKVAVCLETGTSVAPSELSTTFQNVCGGCHGPTGQGVGSIPKVPGALTFDAFRRVVRDGRGARMPALDQGYVPDAVLVRDYATLTGKALQVPAGLDCQEATGDWTDARIEAAVTKGREAYGYAKGPQGETCTSCHMGPLPYDAAFIGYDDATIFRRALMHVGQDDSHSIVDAVHALRAKYRLEGRDRSRTFRPYQPGNAPLVDENATPAVADQVFGESLARACPTLGGAPITTPESAKKALDEFMAINPRTFPIGISLDRYARDKFFGPTDASLSDFLPDLPRVLPDSAAEASVRALEDAYLADPTTERLFALEDKRLEVSKPVDGGGPQSQGLFDSKLRSVAFAQHDFHMKMSGRPSLEALAAAPFLSRNALWSVGEFGHFGNGVQDMPKVTLDNIDPNVSVSVQVARLGAPWFLSGWLFDRTLCRTGNTNNNSIRSSEYFTGELYEKGYYNHLTYVRLRKNLDMALDPTGVVMDGSKVNRLAHVEAQNWGYFLAYGRGLNENSMPPAGPSRDLYVTLLANGMRMMAHSVVEEVERTKSAWSPAETLRSFSPGFADFLGLANGADLRGPASALTGQAATDRALLDRLAAVLGTACDSSGQDAARKCP